MGQKGYQSPVKKLLSWVQKQSKKVKIVLFIVTLITLLVTLKLTVHNHDYFFVMAEAIHLIGLLILIYKLTTLKTCSGNLISFLNFFSFFVDLEKKTFISLCFVLKSSRFGLNVYPYLIQYQIYVCQIERCCYQSITTGPRCLFNCLMRDFTPD